MIVSMEVHINEFEKGLIFMEKEDTGVLTPDEINEKYEKGEARIVTEQGAIKLPLISSIFDGDKYEKMPVYQRRITWDDEKRSKLIESFIMNIPIPPIFIYEIEFGKYEVMDGLQRISAIQDYYDGKYELKGLSEWKELNGLKYDELPQKIREGIDRRQISVISLLKESAKTPEQEQKMKRMVFERLNTGGVKLEPQEIRNALYDGPFNKLCKELSATPLFRQMWGIPNEPEKNNDSEYDIDDEVNFAYEIAKNKMYMRMYDVELVLRFFAMRHLEEFVKLSDFLDAYLIFGNNKIKENADNEEKYRQLFIKEIEKVYKIFGEKAFCIYTKQKSGYKWSSPKNMIFDPLMLAVSNFEIVDENIDADANIKILKEKYISVDETFFDGKRQSKVDIRKRMDFFVDVMAEISGVKYHEQD